MSKSDWVPIASVRAVLLLVRELEDLTPRTEEYNRHLREGILKIVGAALVGTAATRAVGTENAPVAEIALSGASTTEDAVVRRPYEADGAFANPMVVELASKLASPDALRVVGTRTQSVDNWHWYSSDYFQQVIRPLGFDDHMILMRRARKGSESFVVGVIRDRGGSALSDVDARLLELLDEQLVDSENARAPAYLNLGLPPRQLETCAALLRGLSEKEIADQLSISPHTVHSYVKHIYRRVGARSRSELMARLASGKSRNGRR